MLSLSFELYDSDRNLVGAWMTTCFEAFPHHLHDLEVTTRKQTVMVWFKSADIGLELDFRRLDEDEVNSIMLDDQRRTNE